MKLTTATIVFFSCLIFVLPAILLAISDDGVVMANFQVMKLNNMWLDISLIMLLWGVLVFLTYVINVKLVFKSTISISVLDFFAFFYVLIGCVSIFIINDKVQPFELLGKNSTQVGIVFSQSGVLKYYLSLYALIISFFWFLNRLPTGNVFFYLLKIIFHFFIFGLMIFLFALTRREMLFVLLLMYFFYLKKFKFSFDLYTGFLSLSVVFLVTYVTFLFRGVELNSFFDFFRSQEFMPVQFGMVLIDKWVDAPYIDDLLRVFPLSFFTIDMDFTSLNKYYLEDVFRFGSFGPTISFFPVFFIYGFFIPLLYFMVHVFLMRFAEINISRGFAYPLLFCFISIRMLLFIRNGEMVNSLIEVFFFLFFLFPFFFYKDKRELANRWYC